VLNYLTSFVSPSLLLFLSVMSGLSLAMVIVKGPAMLMLFPLLAGFVLMVTAVTYQFRGWLAILMVNKRRRRAVIAVLMVGFMVVLQAPQLVNIYFMRQVGSAYRQGADELDKLLADLQAGKISQEEFKAKHEAFEEETQRQEARQTQELTRVVVLANTVLPIGWLPAGMRSAAMGGFLAPLLGSLGAGAIGALSLRRSYRKTIQFYTGGDQSKKKRAKPTVATDGKTRTAAPSDGSNFLEKKFRFLSEHATTVALANFQSLMRAPEAKMMLLTPLIMLTVFGAMFYAGPARGVPELVRPFIGVAAIGMTMMGLMQLLLNQFGFDRAGFRAYVLSPVARRDVLLGKNVSLAPFAFGMGLVILIAVQILVPMRIGYLLGTLVQFISIYLMFCMMGNQASILVPTAIKAGGFKAAQPTALVVLFNLFCMMLTPFAFLPAVIPIGIDMLLVHSGMPKFIPVFLLLSLGEVAVVVWVYLRVIEMQGRLLERREQKILDVVTTHVD
jgi:hypothetical protein